MELICNECKRPFIPGTDQDTLCIDCFNSSPLREHYHVAKYVNDILTDECAFCGKDLRDAIHRRCREMKMCDDDICGLCGKPGADKYAHPVHWPGEQVPDGPLVHESCEDEECRRAHSLLTDKQRKAFLGLL